MNKTTYTEIEASEYIGMSRSFLRQDRMNGIRVNRTPGPKFLKIGRSIRYLKEDLDTWLMQHRVTRRSI
jgi:predicted DNA-binding transcriptional regulator AlpA